MCMAKFRAKNLNHGTSQESREALVRALRSVHGVGHVIVHAERSEVEVRGQGVDDPRRDALDSAARRVGFELTEW